MGIKTVGAGITVRIYDMGFVVVLCARRQSSFFHYSAPFLTQRASQPSAIARRIASERAEWEQDQRWQSRAPFKFALKVLF